MDETRTPAAETPRDDDRFAWHPQYGGQTVGEVRGALRDEIRGDQRSYALAIDGPDEREGDILVRVVGLEKRWGPYAMDWAAADPGELAERVVGHEWAREGRRELFPYRELRDAARPASVSASGGTGGGTDVGDDGDRPWWAFWRR